MLEVGGGRGATAVEWWEGAGVMVVTTVEAGGGGFLASSLSHLLRALNLPLPMPSWREGIKVTNHRRGKIDNYNTYEGHSKSSKTNSKKYFIYEIYKIIFQNSFHPIHNTSVSVATILSKDRKAFVLKQ